MRFHFVVNPVAGRGRALPVLDAVCRGLEARGHETSRHVTAGRGDGSAHVATLAPDAIDRLVVVGGDGTLREVMNARPLPYPWPVGVVPMGTANLAGRELGMPLRHRADLVAARLAAATEWPVDLLRVDGADGERTVAVCVVGAGFDGEMVAAVDRIRAGVSGSGGYARWIRPMVDVVRGLRFPRLRVTVDGRRTYAASACVVQNAHAYGGLFALSPEAALDSGALDVVMVRSRSHRDLVRIACSAFLRQAHRHHDVKIVRGTRVRIRAPEAVPLQADGDPAGRTDVSVALLPRAANFLSARKAHP